MLSRGLDYSPAVAGVLEFARTLGAENERSAITQIEPRLIIAR